MAFNAGAAVAQFLLDTTNYEQGVKKIGKKNKLLQTSVKALGKAFVAIGAAVTTGVVKSIKSANEFQKAFSNVNTLVDQTQVNTQEMAKELLALDSRLGTAKDLTDGLYQALSASVEPTKAVQFVGEAAKFAGAALVDTATSVDVITTGLNAYGLEADKAGQISDQLFSVIKLGKTTGDELAATIGQSIPLAANMGISFDELGASIAIMTRQGINSANATTQFNAAVNAFLKPSDAMVATLKELGFESGSAAIEQLGFKGALDAVTNSTGGSKDEMAALFANTRALRGALALTGEGAKDFDSVLNEIQNSAGATQEAFDKQEKTFETLRNQLDKMSVLIGNVGKNFVDKLAVGASSAAQSMIDFVLSGRAAEPIGNVIGHISGAFNLLKEILKPVVSTLFPELKEIGGTIATAIGKITGKADGASGAFSLLSTILATGTTVLRILSTQIQVAITNIGNLITAIRESGETVSSFFEFIARKKSWDEVKNQANAAADAFKDFGLGVVETWSDLFNTVGEEVMTFKDRASGLATSMELSYTSAFNGAKGDVVSSFDEMITGQAAFVDAVLSGNEGILRDFQNTGAQIVANNNNTTRDIIDNMERIRISMMSVSEEEIKRQKELQEEYKNTAGSIATTFGPVLSELGATLVDAEKGWESFKDSALNAIATVVEGFGKQWALQAMARFAVKDFEGGAGLAAAAAAAFVGAGVIRGLETGGVANGLTLVGEGGPELINVGSPSRVFNNEDTMSMLSQRPLVIEQTNYIYSDIDMDMANRKLGIQLKNVLRKL